LGRKHYTVLVFSQQAARVKKFIFSPLTLKVGAAVLVLLLIFSGYLFYDYVSYQKKVFDLKKLRVELNSQQSEIQSFLEKITFLEEQLARLKLVEEQVKKDLKEVQELKREKKVKKLPPLPAQPKRTQNYQNLPTPVTMRLPSGEKKSPSWKRSARGWSAGFTWISWSSPKRPSRGSRP
jgi:cell shape-determining protein MreC